VPTVSIDPAFAREFPATDRYLIAVSGGRDSIALLHFLVQCGYKNLVVCHLNHQLRGRSSQADARFVEKLAQQHGLTNETGSVSVRALAAAKKMSIETAARHARYSFFAAVARQTDCRAIFVAHHADDLVETFLINLFRGAGMAGLTSMRERSSREVDGVELTILRPFLHVWRKEIDQYVRKRRLKFREDASNRDTAPLRNRIRRRIIPYLEKSLGRNIRENIWRTAFIAAEEESVFENLVPDAIPKLGALALEPLRKLSVALQRRALHRWLRESEIADVGFEVVERVRALLDVAGGVAKTNLPGKKHVRRREKKIFIEG
jgi:tRNA(Ile)-lysidine synthase